MKSIKLVIASLFIISLASCEYTENASVNGADQLSGTEISKAVTASNPAVKLVSARTMMSNVSGQTYNARISGDIDLENLAYAKTVKVVYLNQGTWKEASATYVKSLGNNREQWSFKTDLGSYINTGDPRAGYTGTRVVTQFAVKYTVNGATYWDNNGGSGVDYRVSTEGSGTAQYAPAAFGKSNVTLTYSSLTDYPNTYFRGTVAVKKFGTNRSVKVIYTTDGWKTVLNAPSVWLKNSYPEADVYFFSEGTSVSASIYEFAICYTVDGIEYWDNNFNSNYKVSAGVNEPKYF